MSVAEECAPFEVLARSSLRQAIVQGRDIGLIIRVLLSLEHSLKKKLVVSAVNLIEGGTLTVLRECLRVAVSDLGNEWDIVALVHDKNLIGDLPTVQCIEFPKAKRSWLWRLYYELHMFKSLSKRLDADIWLSLHDITPNVCARRQVVYCHNPSPFYRLTLRESLLDPTFFVFNKLYSFIYKLNIQRNYHVVVQQKWLREEFMQRYGVDSVVVAHPVASISSVARERRCSDVTVFLFPALSRFFKNFEVICEAVALLVGKGVKQFEVRLTIDGKENRYSVGLFKRFSDLDAIRFIGRQNQMQMAAQYKAADCLLFPSRLETWGLPITEAKGLQMPMLVADVPYAHETVGTYDKVRFFPATDATTLATLMEEFIVGRLRFDHVVGADPAAPFAKDWRDLLKILTAGL